MVTSVLGGVRRGFRPPTAEAWALWAEAWVLWAEVEVLWAEVEVLWAVASSSSVIGS